jgi:hypothetical protein
MVNHSSLLLIPDGEMSADDIFGVAVSYANSVRVIQGHSGQLDDPRYLFPAMTCASFALELLVKFFVFKSIESQDVKSAIRGHKVNQLWKKVRPELQDIVVGMYHNKSGEPFTNALDRRREVFENALNELILSGSSGHAQPFVDWRYPYELSEMKLMALEPVLEVMEVFGQAAQYVINQEKEKNLESNT